MPLAAFVAPVPLFGGFNALFNIFGAEAEFWVPFGVLFRCDTLKVFRCVVCRVAVLVVDVVAVWYFLDAILVFPHFAVECLCSIFDFVSAWAVVTAVGAVVRLRIPPEYDPFVFDFIDFWHTPIYDLRVLITSPY
jgi:hypothetical protein